MGDINSVTKWFISTCHIKSVCATWNYVYLTAFSALKDDRIDQSRVDCEHLLYFFVVPYFPLIFLWSSWAPLSVSTTENWNVRKQSKSSLLIENVILWRRFLDWWTRGRGLSSFEVPQLDTQSLAIDRFVNGEHGIDPWSLQPYFQPQTFSNTFQLATFLH